MGLPASRRLRRQVDFSAVRAGGLRSQCGPFILQFLPRHGENGDVRFAVVASRRVGGSVKRHRGKRLFREILRHNEAFLPGAGDCVVILRRGFDRHSYADLEALFRKACASLGKRR